MGAAVNTFPGTVFTSIPLTVRGVINAQDPVYGADPTGTSDSAAAIRAAITACGSGGVVWLGSGTFKVKSTIGLVSGVSVIGAGYHATTVMVDDTSGNIGDAFKLDAIHGCTISGLTVDALSQRAAGTMVNVLGGDSSVQLGSFKISRSQHVIDVDLNNFYDGIVVQDKSATNGAWGVSIGGTAQRFNFYRNGATGRFPIDINTPHGASVNVGYAWLVGNATPSTGPAGVRLRASGDTSFYGVRTWGVQNGLIIDPQVNGAESVMALDCSGCYWDFANGACFRFNPIASLTVPIIGTFTNTWFASSATTHNIWGSNGTGHSILFRGCSSLNAAGFGLRGDTGCDATTFGNSNCFFGPPLANASGTTSYV